VQAAEAGVPISASPSPAPEKTAKPRKRTVRLSEGAAEASVVAKKKSSKKREAK